MKLLLCGGGCGDKTILANKKFDEIIDHNKPLLYVPLAMNEVKHPYDGCLEWIKNELSTVNIPHIEMVRTFEEFASKNFSDYCAIFIGGGNTYKLLRGIKDSGTFEKLRKYLNNDGIIYGGSAGAIIFGYDIDCVLPMDANDVELKDTKGFDMLGGKSIFAHYTNEHSEDEHMMYKNSLINYTKNNEDVIALPEEDTVYIDDDKVSIIGTRDYYEFVDGVETQKEIDAPILKK